jgi:hypothetical protein
MIGIIIIISILGQAIRDLLCLLSARISAEQVAYVLNWTIREYLPQHMFVLVAPLTILLLLLLLPPPPVCGGVVVLVVTSS